MDKLPRRDLKILMGDLNAKVRADNTNRELIMGKHGVGVQNENGELLTEFHSFNDLVIGGTVFQHKQIHKTTWTSSDERTVNQIDHVTIGRKWRRSLLDVRVKRGADAASDHHLVVADLKVKLKVYRDRADRPSHKYNIHSLKDKTKAEVYQSELRNRFSALAHQPEESVEETWCGLRDTWKVTCNEVMGKKTRQHKVAVSPYLNTHQREETAKERHQPDPRPATEARSTGPVLGAEPTGQEKHQSGREEIHTRPHRRSRNSSWQKRHEEAV
ncbi:craniofacial development protein 2-like [Montipora foliosa]|uniref:craniofacial development protein 2-like n=1 Tax=Montipora foliosa TaxID=591990 RepID=UPI0035F209D5